MSDNKIKVLWVEDNPGIVDAYQRQASRFGLNLVHFPYWEDAEAALKGDYNSWQAIILDAKCPVRKNDIDDADAFLSYAIDRIRDIANERRRTIPWYVLSGDAERPIDRIIPPSRRKWDGDWDEKVYRPFYSKRADVEWGDGMIPERHALFKRIKSYVERYDQELVLRNNLYQEVFVATQSLLDKGLNGEVERYLVELLAPIHFADVPHRDYNNRYSKLRKIIEHIFRHMVEMQILPPIIKGKDGKKESDGKINLSWGSLFLGGEFDGNGKPKQDDKLWSKVMRITPNNAPILPKQLAEYVKLAIFESGAALHTDDEDSKRMNYDHYMSVVGNSSYMLRAFALATCDFILWYDKYLTEHSDEEINSLTWTNANEKI
jgi:hypothetical protein